MMEGKYYKEWSRVLDRYMEFKVYGVSGAPLLALPARGGRFYDWENNAMPDAIASLINSGKVQLFCADSVDSESLLADGALPRRRAETQEKYFNYLALELAPRILELNAAKADTAKDGDGPAKTERDEGIWCAGVDMGAYQAVNCRLRRPELFLGAIALSGVYDMSRFLGDGSDDLALRSSPLLCLSDGDIYDAEALKAADESSLILCAGKGAYEDEARAETEALGAALSVAGLPAHIEIWGGDVSHEWYWWGKELSIFAERVFG